MAGIITDPTAATVPGPDPLIAEKNMQPRIVAIPSPPRTRPVNWETTAMIWWVTPPRSMREPARMKQGIARSGNLSTPW